MTRWGSERNPTVGAALVADTEYLSAPRSCFRAESSQTSWDNKAEIKGPISRQRGVILKSGLRGEESELFQLRLFPWLLRAFVVGTEELRLAVGKPSHRSGSHQHFLGKSGT